jgi:hypothetical protein
MRADHCRLEAAVQGGETASPQTQLSARHALSQTGIQSALDEVCSRMLMRRPNGSRT